MNMRFWQLLLGLFLLFFLFPARAQQSEVDRVRELLVQGSQGEAKQAIFDCAVAGNEECLFELAKFVEEGSLFQRDLETSKKLFELSYAGGYEPAGEELLRLTRVLANEDKGANIAPAVAQSSLGSVDTQGVGSSLAVRDVGDNADSFCQPARRIGRGSFVDCGVKIEAIPVRIEEGILVVRMNLNNETSESRMYGLSDIRARQNSKQLKILKSQDVAALQPKHSQGVKRGLKAASLLVGVLGGVAFDGWGVEDLLAGSAVEGASSSLDEMADETDFVNREYVDAIILDPGQKSNFMLKMHFQSRSEEIDLEFDVDGRTAILPMRIDDLPEK